MYLIGRQHSATQVAPGAGCALDAVAFGRRTIVRFIVMSDVDTMRIAVMFVIRHGNRGCAGMMLRVSASRKLRGRQQRFDLMTRPKRHHGQRLRAERQAQKQQRNAAKFKEIRHSSQLKVYLRPTPSHKVHRPLVAGSAETPCSRAAASCTAMARTNPSRVFNRCQYCAIAGVKRSCRPSNSASISA